jgi:hypothetical protein
LLPHTRTRLTVLPTADLLQEESHKYSHVKRRKTDLPRNNKRKPKPKH